VRIYARIVLVPEAATHFDNLAEFREYEIRFPWQVSFVQAISEPQAMRDAAHRYLGLHSCAFDSPHVFAAALSGEAIGHGSYGNSGAFCGGAEARG
jgi:hypothetical protein